MRRVDAESHDHGRDVEDDCVEDDHRQYPSKNSRVANDEMKA